VPVAVNCLVVPNDIEGAAGLTLMETKVAGVTVSAVEPTTEPKVALIIVCPVARLVASPTLGALLLIVATPLTVLLQDTVLVIFRVLPSV
jgi:hypothetical protein